LVYVDRLEDDGLLRSLGSVLGTTLLTILNAHRVQGTTDDMIAYPGKVLHPTPSDEHDGVFLKVMAYSWDIGGYLNAIG
jgi:hypothetical protein